MKPILGTYDLVVLGFARSRTMLRQKVLKGEVPPPAGMVADVYYWTREQIEPLVEAAKPIKIRRAKP